MEKTLQTMYYDGFKILEKAQIDSISFEVYALIEHVLNKSKVYVLTHPQEVVASESYDAFMEKVRRRAKKEPLQYIIGMQGFMGLDFYVSPSVLIPRQDTELLVETVIEYIKKFPFKGKLLDMCTGSGCIAISIGHFTAIEHIVAVDVSIEALRIAKKNASLNHLERIDFVQSDLFENITGEYDFIVSNPPYIPTKDIEGLMKDVKDFEPKLALDGMEDGLYFYKRISREARNYLKNSGSLFFEIGYNQGEEVKRIMENEGYENIIVLKDLADLDRVVYGTKTIRSVMEV